MYIYWQNLLGVLSIFPMFPLAKALSLGMGAGPWQPLEIQRLIMVEHHGNRNLTYGYIWQFMGYTHDIGHNEKPREIP